MKTRRGKGTHVLQFNPALFAQLPVEQRSNIIGVIIPDWGNPFYHAILQGVEQIAEINDTLILLSNAHDDPQAAWRDFAMLSAKGLTASCSVSHDVSDYLDASSMDNGRFPGTPFVTVDAPDCRGILSILTLIQLGTKLRGIFWNTGMT